MKETRIVEAYDLQGYWRIMVRRRWVIYLAVLTCALVGLIGSFLTTPMYRATARLQIERNLPDILNMNQVAHPDYWTSLEHFYQTQYEIISSAPVARIAVERLGLTEHDEFAPKAQAPGLLTRLKRLVPRKARPHVERSPVDIAAARLQAGLEVLPVTYSYLVDVSWVHTDPQFAADVTNAIADAYIQFSLRAHFSTTDQAREFLVGQIGTLKQEVAAIEARLQEYAEAKKILSVDNASNLTLKALQEIAEQRTGAETALTRAESALRAVTESPPESLPEVMDSDLIARLRAEYATYEAQYSEKSQLFGSDWPGMRTLSSRLEQARQRLELETERIAGQVRANREADYKQAQNQVASLERLLAKHEAAARLLQHDAVEYTSLQSEVTKKRETLDALMKRQNEMALSTRLQDLDVTSGNIQIVERAQAPAVPYRPRTAMNLLLGVLAGLTFGPALAFLLDHLDNTVTSADELQALVPVPLLAVIPRHGSPEPGLSRVRRKVAAQETIDLIAHVNGRTRAAEAYRSLRTSILLSSPGRPPRRILLTSAIPEEGKTATTLNLGVVLAQLGRRVVLVDTDLRRPRLHRALNLGNTFGASTFLSGMEKDPARLVQPTSVEHLYFIASGPVPPNPSELLNSPIFSRLGSELLEEGFDHVIFDSPPVLSVSDPVIVAAIADAAIVVVRAGMTPRQSIRAAVERLAQSGGGPLGVVLNRFDPQSHGRGYDRYDYDMRYVEGDGRESPPAGESAKRASGGA